MHRTIALVALAALAGCAQDGDLIEPAPPAPEDVPLPAPTPPALPAAEPGPLAPAPGEALVNTLAQLAIEPRCVEDTYLITKRDGSGWLYVMLAGSCVYQSEGRVYASMYVLPSYPAPRADTALKASYHLELHRCSSGGALSAEPPQPATSKNKAGTSVLTDLTAGAAPERVYAELRIDSTSFHNSGDGDYVGGGTSISTQRKSCP